MTTWWAARAVIDGSVRSNVVLEAVDGVFTQVEPEAEMPWHARILEGAVLPGAVNAHSHAFHRVLRSRTHRGRDSFWSWRDQMYAAAAVLDPETYRGLARAVFAEMLQAGYTAVGEFHYLHHAPGARRTATPMRCRTPWPQPPRMRAFAWCCSTPSTSRAARECHPTRRR